MTARAPVATMPVSFWYTEADMRAGLAFLVTVLLVASSRADESTGPVDPPSGPSKPVAEEVAALVRDLGHDDFRRRRDATRRLLALGDAAVDALVPATRSPEPEVRHRARKVLTRIIDGAIRRGFVALARKPDREMDIEEGMWLVARIVDPRVRRVEIDRGLDELGDALRKKIAQTAGADTKPRDIPPAVHIAAMREVFQGADGFTGNRDFYNDPRNSSIAYVLEERKGLPILLSHVMLAAARRADVPLRGLAVPGKYMCYYDATGQSADTDGSRVLNPFDGEVLTAAEARAAGYRFDAFTADSPRSALDRMLANLHHDVALAGRTDLAERIVEYRAVVQSGPAE